MEKGIVGINFGKNKDRVLGGKGTDCHGAGIAVLPVSALYRDPPDGTGLGDDYVELMQRLSPSADFLVINISSPNTPNLRLLQVRLHYSALEQDAVVLMVDLSFPLRRATSSSWSWIR